jgi:hypothetical protein
MIQNPYTLATPDTNDYYSTHMMKHCVRILERHLGKELLYKNAMVTRILGLLQCNEPRNRAARAWALCFLMCHFEPIYRFVESLTVDKTRLHALMQVLPQWIEAQQNFAYNAGNVRNMLAEFFLHYVVPLYVFGPTVAPPAPTRKK